MTSLRKVATSAVVAVSLIAGQLATSVSASADGLRHRGPGWGYRGPAPRHVAPPPPRHYGYGHSGHRRDRSGDAVGAAILGIGALIVGSAIAEAARKNRHRDYDDDDND